MKKETGEQYSQRNAKRLFSLVPNIPMCALTAHEARPGSRGPKTYLCEEGKEEEPERRGCPGFYTLNWPVSNSPLMMRHL